MKFSKGHEKTEAILKLWFGRFSDIFLYYEEDTLISFYTISKGHYKTETIKLWFGRFPDIFLHYVYNHRHMDAR